MELIAHTCQACHALTIFAADATFPRRCARCDRVVRVSVRPLAKCDSRIYDIMPTSSLRSSARAS